MKTTKTKPWHTANTKIGKGTSYGTGMKNPVGKIRDMYQVDGNSPMKMGKKKPPKNLA